MVACGKQREGLWINFKALSVADTFIELLGMRATNDKSECDLK